MAEGPSGSRAIDTLAAVCVIAASIVVLSRTGMSWVRELHTPAAPALSAQVAPAGVEAAPVPRQQEIRFESSEVIGSLTAKVGIVQYVDFECSFCAMFARDIWPALQSRYVTPGTVVMVLKQFPLQSHSNGRRAALGAMCAGQQGRLADMHDELFRRHSRLTASTGGDLAQLLGLHQDTFAECLTTAAIAVDNDIAAAKAVGIRATPSFVLGRVLNDRTVRLERLLVGMQPVESFQEALETLMAETEHIGKAGPDH